MFFVFVFVPALFPTVNVTLYQPGVLNTTVGFCDVEVEGVAPGIDQFHEVITAL
jgi:hypothetical protein